MNGWFDTRALSLASIGRRPDVVLAFIMACIVSMLIVPLPGFMLDALMALNIAVGPSRDAASVSTTSLRWRPAGSEVSASASARPWVTMQEL